MIFNVGFGLLFILFHPYVYLSIRFGIFDKQKTLLRLCKAAHLLLLVLSLSRVRRVFRGEQSSIFDEVEIPIRQDLPILVVANHQSAYDISSIILTFPRRHLFFIAKKELRWLPSFSTLLEHYNGIFIDRSDPKSAVDQIKISVEKIKRMLPGSKLGFVVFPEGTRAKDGVLKNFKQTGTKIIVEQLQTVQVIPVVFTKNHLFGKRVCTESKMLILEPELIDIPRTESIEPTIDRIFNRIKSEYLAMQDQTSGVK